MIIIGLTGSIGMGKSTTAEMFEAMGIPVNSADAVVHQLYEGEAAPLIEEAFPGTAPDGVVDRRLLSEQLMAAPDGFARLEAIIHPLVRAREQEFIARARSRGEPMVVLDIPLLFETGAADRVDRIVVVSCAPEIQRERVLARAGMTEAKFAAILSRQTPDADKRQRADYVIDTGNGIDAARQQVADIVEELKGSKQRSRQDA
ncbi:MAG: dephospho-CoA kinase [Hoeflea sp.]|uniref:dephospho-CoA kinase n=1 Tax=Hoeflea sp. TaxID=1940281 RepID=UPI001DFA4A74|nr:dephospho-CoA kinase [Hoeflea sp.]MBU4531778.1 dephospho-CoA kinase [Alphaproteobacteria bacterium]MBU4544634.1 dephospho-CoA kinase [Alphaproteobacteria bacterium]MBU4552865.1 dephospho-CoA kinase [Alphaproteobacteria bacterium]MBV1725054.1 dephospho-CoA kinase [Hoeflea sp.]MBV1761074.1 dephospho-CoA kinase [Hoeflea sp.]